MSDFKFKIEEKWKNSDGLYDCPECDCKFSKMGLISHYYRKHDDRGINFLKERKDNSKGRKIKPKLSKEEKSLIYSNVMKKRYQEGKCEGWNHINSNKNRRSYPERFFLRVFDNNDIFRKYRIEEKFPYGKYVIDFLIVELKLIIEIDGQQHFRTEDAIEHDKIRDQYFLNEGFKIYRVKWIDVCKDTKYEIEQLINFIENIDNETIRKYSIDDVKIKYFCKCGKEKTKKGKTCMTCKIINNRKIKERPDIDILLEDVKNIGYSATGRKYSVSDNTIRKWIKNGSIV